MIRKLVILIVAMFGLGCHTQAQTNITNTSDSIDFSKLPISMSEDNSINHNSYSTINCYEKIGLGIKENSYSFSFTLGGISHFSYNIYTTFGIGFTANYLNANQVEDNESYSSASLLGNIDLGYIIGNKKTFVAPIIGLNLHLGAHEMDKEDIFGIDFRLGTQIKLHSVIIYGVCNFFLNNSPNSFIINSPYPEFGIGFIL